MGLADILWKAGVACYGTPVTTAGRVHRESTKNVYSLLRKIRLTSYVGLNAGIVYNSDPTSRISNFLKPCGSTVDVWSMTVGHVLSFVYFLPTFFMAQPFGISPSGVLPC